MATRATDTPVWFITGCSTGFGREFARTALAHGFRVVATARDPKKLDDIIAGYDGKALTLALDVMKSDQIARAVSEAERLFGRINHPTQPISIALDHASFSIAD
ncbi:SDR family NAD(P)-dependent oxidoreductase [Bradyrhizobium cenepequi]